MLWTAAAIVLLLVLAGVVLAVSGWTAFGSRATGARLRRMQRSPQWKDGKFVNPQPLWNDYLGGMTTLFRMSPHANPKIPIPVERVDRSRFQQPPPSGLWVTWLGHSTVLLEIDGRRVLIDPVWGERSSPLSWLGPRRWYDPPLPLDEVPEVDAVLISHDHVDHLSHPTIVAIKDWDTRFVVPLGVGAHLAYWGVPEQRIIELDWWERTDLKGVDVVCTPARHASGRNPLAQNRSLWAGFALLGSTHRVYHSGDTGLFPGLEEIGSRLGPFDLTMIEVGAYNRAWPDWHIGPEQAVRAQRMVRGDLLLPIHWGMWNLATHGWTEPVERLIADLLLGANE